MFGSSSIERLESRQLMSAAPSSSFAPAIEWQVEERPGIDRDVNRPNPTGNKQIDLLTAKIKIDVFARVQKKAEVFGRSTNKKSILFASGTRAVNKKAVLFAAGG